PPTGVQREAARKELGLSADALVSFWTGFIQQTTEDDFHAAVKTANLVLDRGGSKFAFLFCLKPEHFKESFRASERPGLRVFGSAEAFHAARLAADVFLSPIQDARSTAAPPLAWLEALAMGIPILPTNIPGSEAAAFCLYDAASTRSKYRSVSLDIRSRENRSRACCAAAAPSR